MSETGSLQDKLEMSTALNDARRLIWESVNQLQTHIHRLNRSFYRSVIDDTKMERNLPELIALMHSELSEMLEGVRKSTMDAHLPNRRAEEVELADLLIRALDYAGYRELDLAGAMADKLKYNATRADHTHEARRAQGGKKF